MGGAQDGADLSCSHVSPDVTLCSKIQMKLCSTSWTFIQEPY